MISLKRDSTIKEENQLIHIAAVTKNLIDLRCLDDILKRAQILNEGRGYSDSYG